MLHTLRIMLHYLTALSETFQTVAIHFLRITPNIEKGKSKLQQLFDERKPLMLLQTELENRLQRQNLKLDKQVEETIHSMTERYMEAMLWNIDEMFLST